ncbi:hypothetical protein [Variovorax sp.]|uniref:hypothetical protein n=1 Tax=Variovorax sp. TaxID=1871043 RepID=UPI002D2F29D7|nr:hypothetical protein [Variovorax sp.]HYP83639.1 hypothetical protein [Variovorax sp.]
MPDDVHKSSTAGLGHRQSPSDQEGTLPVLAALWVPSAIWLWITLQPKVAIVLTILLAYAFVEVGRGGVFRAALRRERPARSAAAAIVLFSLAWAAFTGLPFVMTINTDWFVRLEALDQFREPAWQLLDADGRSFLFRFPGAYYAVAAVFGGVSGIGTLRTVLFITTALTCAIALHSLYRKTAGRMLAAFLFVLLCINGLDLVGAGLLALRKGVALPPFGFHVEWWSTFQYSGLTTAMIWVPNHLLPALLFCAVLPLTRQGGGESPMGRLHVLVLAAAGTMLWSPLVFLGTIPLIAAQAWSALEGSTLRRRLGEVKWGFAAAILAIMLVISWYLTLESGPIRKGFYYQSCGAQWLRCSGWLAFFYVAEAIPLAWLCSRLPNRPVGLAAAFTLLVLPLLVYGPSNDLTMRASLPAIVIAGMSLHHMLESRATGRAAKAALVLLVVVAGYSAYSEMWRGLTGWRQEPWHPKGFMASFKEYFPEAIVDGYPPHYLIPAAQACRGYRKQVLRGCGA